VRYTLAPNSSQAENTLRVEEGGCGKACGKSWAIRTTNKNLQGMAGMDWTTSENKFCVQEIFFSSRRSREFSAKRF
jgi:hypothetical protein